MVQEGDVRRYYCLPTEIFTILEQDWGLTFSIQESKNAALEAFLWYLEPESLPDIAVADWIEQEQERAQKFLGDGRVSVSFSLSWKKLNPLLGFMSLVRLAKSTDPKWVSVAMMMGDLFAASVYVAAFSSYVRCVAAVIAILTGNRKNISFSKAGLLAFFDEKRPECLFSDFFLCDCRPTGEQACILSEEQLTDALRYLVDKKAIRCEESAHKGEPEERYFLC